MSDCQSFLDEENVVLKHQGRGEFKLSFKKLVLLLFFGCIKLQLCFANQADIWIEAGLLELAAQIAKDNASLDDYHDLMRQFDMKMKKKFDYSSGGFYIELSGTEKNKAGYYSRSKSKGGYRSTISVTYDITKLCLKPEWMDSLSGDGVIMYKYYSPEFSVRTLKVPEEGFAYIPDAPLPLRTSMVVSWKNGCISKWELTKGM